MTLASFNLKVHYSLVNFCPHHNSVQIGGKIKWFPTSGKKIEVMNKIRNSHSMKIDLLASKIVHVLLMDGRVHYKDVVNNEAKLFQFFSIEVKNHMPHQFVHMVKNKYNALAVCRCRVLRKKLINWFWWLKFSIEMYCVCY